MYRYYRLLLSTIGVFRLLIFVHANTAQPSEVNSTTNNVNAYILFN